MSDFLPSISKIAVEVFERKDTEKEICPVCGRACLLGELVENGVCSYCAKGGSIYASYQKDEKRVARAFASHLIIEEEEIVLQRNGKPIVFGEFNSDNVDPSSGMFVHHAVARLNKGVPNPKQRPILPCPWAAEFHITLMPTKQLQVEDVRRVFDEGGAICGWGTFRPYFGRFQVVEFDVEKT